MLRAVLLACPVVLMFAVSCSSTDSASFTNGGPNAAASTGASSSTSGASTGGTAAQGGGNADAGSTAAGKGSSGGSSNAAGNNGNAGNANTAGNNGNGGNGNAAGNQSTGGKGGNGNAGTSNAGTTNAGTTNAGGAGGAGPAMGGAAGAGGASGALCPDIIGTYTITNVDGGAACNGVNKNAMQSIAATEVPCRAHFVSEGQSASSLTGVNGGAAIDENGDFTGATLFINKTQRFGCSGVWDAGNSRMTIKCGGQGELCTVVMERN